MVVCWGWVVRSGLCDLLVLVISSEFVFVRLHLVCCLALGVVWVDLVVIWVSVADFSLVEFMAFLLGGFDCCFVVVSGWWGLGVAVC